MGQDSFMELPFYAIYGGLAAGLFEEVGRYRLPYCNELGHNYDEYIVYRCYHETDDRI